MENIQKPFWEYEGKNSWFYLRQEKDSRSLVERASSVGEISSKASSM
jgi:hypothetical protein